MDVSIYQEEELITHAEMQDYAFSKMPEAFQGICKFAIIPRSNEKPILALSNEYRLPRSETVEKMLAYLKDLGIEGLKVEQIQVGSLCISRQPGHPVRIFHYPNPPELTQQKYIEPNLEETMDIITGGDVEIRYFGMYKDAKEWHAREIRAEEQ